MTRSFRVIVPLRNLTISTNVYKKITTNELKTNIKKASSQQWLSRQLSDPYVEKAKMMNYRCRSAFKLIEIDDRFKILQSGSTVIDCGAAPGSWTQVAVKRVNADNSKKKLPQGKILAIDRQLIYPIEGATIFGNSDFTDPSCQKNITEFLNGVKIDSVISDMAPTATGIPSLDNVNIIQLCYAVLTFALKNSKIGGSVLVKLWQCGDMENLKIDMEKFYGNVRIVKPKSSRSDSKEVFLLGREFKGIKES